MIISIYVCVVQIKKKEYFFDFKNKVLTLCRCIFNNLILITMINNLNDLKNSFAALHSVSHKFLYSHIVTSGGSCNLNLEDNLKNAINATEKGHFLKLDNDEIFTVKAVKVFALEAGFDSDGDNCIFFHGITIPIEEEEVEEVVSFPFYEITDFVIIIELIEYIGELAFKKYLKNK